MDPALEAFAQRLARLRTEAGLSQRELAEAAFVDHTMISRLERAQRRPNPDVAWTIGKILGVAEELRELAAATADRGGGRRTAHTGLVPPPDTIHFVGREGELNRLDTFLSASRDREGAAAVCVLTGMPGIGKTALAIRAAHLFADRFSDGCLYLDLYGFAPRRRWTEPSDALALLLSVLGVPAKAIPQRAAARAAVLRDEVAGKRILFVLDNARSAEQLRPLLPSAAGCRVLATSRRRLSALDDADRIHLAPLRTVDCADLFRRVSGYGDAADRAAVQRIVRACGANPLATRISAARCAAGGSLTPAALAERLAAQQARIADIDDGERSVAAAFRVSFNLLGSAERDLFTLLGLHPATPFAPSHAAVLADLPVPATERLLERLLAASLLEPSGPGLYQMHDLIARFARELAEHHVSAPRVQAAMRRMLDAYLVASDAADTVLTPYRYRIPLAAAATDPPAFPGYAAAHTWLTESLDTLCELCEIAFRHGFDEHCWQLAYNLRGIFFVEKRWSRWEHTHEVALRAAQRTGDAGAVGKTLNNIGLLLGEQNRLGAALETLREAADACRAAEDRHGEFTVRSHRAWILHRLGDYETALTEQRTALDFHRGANSPRNIAIILRDMSATELELGRAGDARAHLREAAEAFESLSLPLDLAMTLNALGELAARTEDPAAAHARHAAAADAAARAGSDYEKARAHQGLGHAAALGGHSARARRHLARAGRIYKRLGAEREAELVRDQLPPLSRNPNRSE